MSIVLRCGSAAFAIIASVLASSAIAQGGSPNAGNWALGGGVNVQQKGYRDIDRDVLPLPMISYESRWISASVPTLDLKAYSGDTVSLRLRARYARDGYEAKDSSYLAGMADRKGSVWVGGAMLWRPGFANFSADVLRDASGYSKATRARVQVDRRFSVGAFGLTPRLGAERVDDKFVNYYYGVRADEVRADRAFYEGAASTNIDAGLRLDYTFARRHTVFVDVRATRFGNTIKDSPLMEKSSQTGASLGYIYRF
jgi:outer membrane protein